MLKLEHPKLAKQQTDFVNTSKLIINKILYEDNNIPQRSNYRYYLDRTKIEDANKVTEAITKYSPIQTPLIINPEISQLENQEYKSEDLEQHVQEFPKIPHLTVLKRYRRSDSDSEPSWNEELFNVIQRKTGKHRKISEDDRIKELQECLKEGAEINALLDDKENTLLHISVKKGYKQIVEFILKQKGIDVDISNKDGKTAEVVPFV